MASSSTRSFPILTLGPEHSPYLCSTTPISTLSTSTASTPLSPSPIPVTVIRVDGLHAIRASWLQSQLRGLLAADDVLTAAFWRASLVLFVVRRGNTFPSVAPETGVWIQGQREEVRRLGTPVFAECDREVPSGPYFWSPAKSHGGLFRVFRLFEDHCAAFMYGVVPDLELGDEGSEDGKEGVPTHLIPVPSRLYSPRPTPQTPLSGLRLAVKDIFAIRGLPTSFGSRAYAQCYPAPARTTAVAIRELLDQGAVLVGKTKTVMFASGMGARDWIDHQCPFNPRGDGYLDPDCSSAGSAAAVAAYGWLDFSIGSDTLGSMTGPAAACGIYGIRPSIKALSGEGALPVSALLDTTGHFSRDVTSFELIANAWLPPSPTPITPHVPPTRILYPPERFQPYVASKLRVMEAFIRQMERVTGVQRTLFDVEDLWRQKVTPEFKGIPLAEYLSTTLANIQIHDGYHNNLPFRAEHLSKFGHEPVVDPLIRYKWTIGSSLTPQDYSAACRQKDDFALFLRQYVFVPGTLLVLPGGDPDVTYRDAYPDPGSLEQCGHDWQGYGLTEIAFSALGGGPCISFPVGQRRYLSIATQREEMQPVSLMLLGPKDSDPHLIALIKYVLEGSGAPLEVRTGREAFVRT